MSCETPVDGFSHLDVKSTIDAPKCKIKRGETARHRVVVTSYALIEVRVEIECRCSVASGLAYASGKPWKPEPRTLSPSLRGVSYTTFDQDLCAAADAGAGTQQLELTVRRRPLRTTKWAASKTIQLKDLEVV